MYPLTRNGCRIVFLEADWWPLLFLLSLRYMPCILVLPFWSLTWGYLRLKRISRGKKHSRELSEFQEWLPETGIDARSRDPLQKAKHCGRKAVKSCWHFRIFSNCSQMLLKELSIGMVHLMLQFRIPDTDDTYIYLYLRVQLWTWLHHHQWCTKPQCTT